MQKDIKFPNSSFFSIVKGIQVVETFGERVSLSNIIIDKNYYGRKRVTEKIKRFGKRFQKENKTFGSFEIFFLFKEEVAL